MNSFKRVALLMICFILSFSSMITVHAAIAPAKVQDVTVSNVSKTQNQVNWTPVEGADGYQIYCKDYTENTNTFKRMKTMNNGNRKYYVIGDRIAGRAYAYIVRAFVLEDGKRVYGEFSDYSYGYISPYDTTLKDVVTTTKEETTTTTPETQQETTSSTVSSVDSSIIVNPTTAQKYKKVFGDSKLSLRYPGGYYTSVAQAEPNMTSINVKTWDFVSGRSGEKTTRTWTIQIHKSLAPTVVQIFKEIYEGAEKFPIHELGGYAWRGGHSEHNTGTAIDINWTENYMVNVATGAISCGKYWKPGEDPYSIAKDGEVARIFNKYGWSQGDWGNSKDYMHFSYFGT